MSVRPQKPHAILIKLAVITALVVALVAIIYGPIVAANMSDAITTRFNGKIAINRASYSIFGPRLTLRGVIIDNPPGYSRSQAMEIKTVTVNFDGFGHDPMR